MVKHKAWATTGTNIAPKLVGSMSLNDSDHDRTDEANMQGEFNCIQGRREQPKQCPRTYYCIQYSNRPDLQKKSQKKKDTVGKQH